MASADLLVGREAELGVAATAVGDLIDGRASALVIEGEAGIGKTGLVQVIAEDARSRGAVVFSGQGHPFERTRPFGVVATALDLNRRSPDRRRAAIGALIAGETAGLVRSAADIQFRVIEAIVELVETACAESPVLLIAEDIHWSDPASLLAISSVTRQVSLAPLLVVVTARPSPLSPEGARLLDDLADGGARALGPGPLTPDDVAVLAGRMLGGPPGPDLSSMLAKAGGNPLWTVAMLQSLIDGGMLRRIGDRVEPTTFELPAALSDLVVRRLRHLPTATLELLRAAAVLGDSVSVRDVAAVARRSTAEVVGQLGDAFDLQLLDEVAKRIVFRHQLVHDAIYQHIPSPLRLLLHREAAGALMAAGADRLDVADHLLLGAEPGDAQVVGWLREAAVDAATKAPLVAVELLRRAEALVADSDPARDPLAAELVGALLRAGLVAEASTRAEAILARPHAPEIDTPVLLALLGALALQNRAAEIIDLVDTSLAGTAGLTPLEGVPMLAQQSWALTYSGDPGAGERAANRGLVIAEQADDAAMTVWARTALLVAVGRQGRFDEALAHARLAAAVDPRDTRSLPLQPRFMLGLTLFDCDLITEARHAFRETLGEEFGSAWWLSGALMADAQVSFALGEWEDALPALIDGGQVAQEKGDQLLVTQAFAYRIIIATAKGDHRQAGELVAGIAPTLEAEELSYNAGILASAVAGLKAAEADRQGAFDVLLRCWRFDATRGCRFYHRALAPDLVRLAVGLGHRAVAAEVAAVTAEGVALAPEVPSVRSLALRSRGLVDGDPEPLLEAVALARRSPLMIDHAGACEDAARVLAGTGRGDEAVALFTEATQLYEQAGADAWARRVRAELRRLGVRLGTDGARQRPVSGWESLTPTERSVSILVAEGLTNAAVARRLYISPYTVNTHLRHIFAKLGVSNRVELATVTNHAIG